MASERNKETLDTLKRELKILQNSCVDVCHRIDNAPPETPAINQEEITQKCLSYIEALKTEIQNSNTPITTDENLLTSQFLNEIKEKTGQIQELEAFVKGSISDIDEEIRWIKQLTEIAQEAKSQQTQKPTEVTSEHIRNAKEKFSQLKAELHGLIHAMFPGKSEAIKEFMGQLMAEKLDPSSNGYIQITPENHCISSLFSDTFIITRNPYNKMEVKLAF